jgi:hypothetical protein
MPKIKSYKSVYTPDYINTDRATDLAVDQAFSIKEKRFEYTLTNLNFHVRRTISFTRWANNDIDHWIWLIIECLEHMHLNKIVAHNTIIGYGKIFNQFFEFLIESKISSHPSDFNKESVKKYIAHIYAKYPDSAHSRKSAYYQFKSVLNTLYELHVTNFIATDLFPYNPLPQSNLHNAQNAAQPFSKDDVIQISNALKKDLISIHRGEFSSSSRDKMGVFYLLVALRTGLNTTSLLELGRDALRPNPFSPNMMVIEFTKRRGNSTLTKALRYSKEFDYSNVIPLDAVAIINMALKYNEVFLNEIDPIYRDRIWIYKVHDHIETSRVTFLNQNTLFEAIQGLVKRHNLTDEFGLPLKINTGRLRKTVEHRLWELSEGDLLSVANEMGHTPKVADESYLRITPEIRKQATEFTGTLLPGHLSADNNVILQMPSHLTPVARCSKPPVETESNRFNESYCTRFSECLSCPSFVLIGSVEDLYKLFSFQRFLIYELEYMQRSEMNSWRELRNDQIQFIDRLVTSRFPEPLVTKAKKMASENPHPFWASKLLRIAN